MAKRSSRSLPTQHGDEFADGVVHHGPEIQSPTPGAENRQLADLIRSWLEDQSGHDETFWPLLEKDLAEFSD